MLVCWVSFVLCEESQWNGVFVCLFVPFPASLHSVLLDSTYLWFMFQLCFFHLQFQPHSFSFSLLFPVFYLASSVHLKTLQNVGTKWWVDVCLLWRKTHAACPVWPTASIFLFLFLFLFLPCQYSHSAFLPREFLDAMTQISFSLLSRKESRA